MIVQMGESDQSRANPAAVTASPETTAMAARKKKAAKTKPKLQKLDAEWQAFIKNAHEHEPPTEPWHDPSLIAPEKRSRKSTQTPRKKARTAVTKRRAPRKK